MSLLALFIYRYCTCTSLSPNNYMKVWSRKKKLYEGPIYRPYIYNYLHTLQIAQYAYAFSQFSKHYNQ